MALFSDSDLKSIATQAIGTKTKSQEADCIDAANQLIDAKVQAAISEKVKQNIGNVTNISNQPDSISTNATQNVSSAGTASQQISANNNIIQQLQAPQINNATNVGSAGNVPSIPQIPDISSALPGGVNFDPSKYIPDLSGIPFGVFISPLFKKALSAAMSKLNVSSFMQQAQGSLGKLSEKTQANLQGLQQQVQGGMNSASDKQSEALSNQVNTMGSNLGSQSKKLSSEGENAKKRLSNYIDMYFLRTSDPQKFNVSPGRIDFLKIYNSV